jgi:phosphoheptose isomerase
MATVTYDHIPGDVVYVISTNGVHSATVVQVLITAQQTQTKIVYKVNLNGTSDFPPADVFATVDLALADYKLRIV